MIQELEKRYKQTDSRNEYLMVCDKCCHNITARPAPEIAYNNELDLGHYYELSWSIESINRINKHVVLAVLGCYSKGDSQLCGLLPRRENITQTKQGDSTLSPPWP